jgi:polysaccharide pyruvyl transferase WcaK-like protein
LSQNISSRQTWHPRVGLLSPYTGGNLGDAAIIESARKQLLGRFGGAEFILLVLDPANVRKIHGLEAFQLSALPLKFYFKPSGAESSSFQGGREPLRQRMRAGLKRVGGHIPFALPVYRRVRDGLQQIGAEACHILDARRIVRNLDALLIAGGGQFDDEFGGPWGHPYAMFKWVRLAHSQRVPVFMIGVGVDRLRYRLSRWFLRQAMAIARRVSLRDSGSMEALRKLRIRRELVLCPDLAFGLLNSSCNGQCEATPSAPGSTIGLSPIAFGLPGSWPTSRRESFDRYWRELQAFTHSLIKDNHSVRLFATDEPDYPLAQMLYDQVVATSTGRDRIQLLPPLKLPDLMAALSNFDAVVASRLHGVLLSHVNRTPVLAISHLRKVRAQMEDMGHERFCLDFETFTAHEARRCLNALLAERGMLVSQLGRVCAGRCKAVGNEFQAICTDLALTSE